MPRPEYVQIGPIRYRITDQEADWHAWEKDGGRKQKKMAGGAWNEQALILVNGDTDVQQQRVTVLHEVMHALVDMFTSYKERTDKETEEGWIGMTDAGLLDTLRRNPDLVAWLLESGS
jgi:hypothetical protein